MVVKQLRKHFSPRLKIDKTYFSGMKTRTNNKEDIGQFIKQTHFDLETVVSIRFPANDFL